ncbi:MAG: hypothetical protein V2B20_11745, partial [Pseudomonadota bacterium]
ALPDESISNFVNGVMPGIQGSDAIVVLSTKVSYEQHWGGYNGLPEQYSRENSGPTKEETPSDFILPYLQQYQLAQTHIHLNADAAGRVLISFPNFLIQPQEDTQGGNLRLKIVNIAEPSPEGLLEPHHRSGAFITYRVAPLLKQTLDAENFPFHVNRSTPIGEYLSPELFYFLDPAESTGNRSPFSSLLLPLMPWIVTHRTPHLAATLVHLEKNFTGERAMFAATGQNDLRNLLCVAGLDIDMKGFRGRKESYFVPWRACWKRQGYCYGDIYPLLQDDLFVALMNLSKEGFAP